jgi:hypothetical protein
MRNSGIGFCQVCGRQMERELSDHCTACELNPTGVLCLHGPLIERWRFLYEQPFRLRWPIPPCLSCPRDWHRLDWRVQVESPMEGLAFQVVDGAGQVVARSVAGRRGQEARFERRPGQQYAVELTSGPVATKGEAAVTTRLFAGDTEIALPKLEGRIEAVTPARR